MKNILETICIIIYITTIQLLATNTSNQDIITFMNNDSIHGSLISLSYKKNLVYKHKSSKNPIKFKTENIQSIKLAHNNTNPQNKIAEIVFNNNSSLRGTITSLTKKSLILNTTYAGKITIEPAMVKQININPKSLQPLYSGPNNINEWQTTNKQKSAFRIEENTLTIVKPNVAIATKVKQPNLIKYEFTLHSSCPMIQFYFCSDNINNSKSNSYSLVINQRQIILRKNTHIPSSMCQVTLVNKYCQEIRNYSKPKITLLVNKITREFIVLLNNNVVLQHTDPKPFSGKGDYIIFRSQSNISISNIKITNWNGNINLLKDDDKITTKIDKDTIIFADGDKITGTLKKIENNNLYMLTEYADITVPLNKIKKIQLACKNIATPRKNKNDIKAIFTDGNSIIMELLSMKNGIIKAKSEIFGEAEYKQSTFQEIILNIYDKRNPINQKQENNNKLPPRNQFKNQIKEGEFSDR